MISENAPFMTASQTDRHVRLLNLEDGQEAGAEWEVVLLNSLSKLGRVQYEPSLGGTSRLDLFVSDCAGIEPFVAEITSVSDAGYERDNPIQDFEVAFHELAKEKQLPPGGFHFQVGGEEVGEFPEQKTRLLLPSRRDIRRFVEKTYAVFLDSIRVEPNRVHTHTLQEPRVEITVTYDPRRRGFSGAGYPSYTSLKARKTNTLYNALSMKAKTLKRCGFEGTRGIVVCDAGASYLSGLSGGVTTFSPRSILGNFFREHSTVSYIMVVRTVPYRDLTSVRLTRDVFLNGYLKAKASDNRLTEILYKSIDILPPPARLATNAYRSVPGWFRLLENSHFGGGSLSSKRVKISARTVHALLAGQLDSERYLASHKNFVGFLERALKQGRSIRAVQLEKSQKEDDDWLTFEFGEPDPAIHRFVNPLRKRTE
jgi:hypothetical protein